MKNSTVMFTLSVFEQKYPFYGNLFQKIKIICWSWNLEFRLIRICRIRRWFSFYSFLYWKYPFWVTSDQKIQIVSLSWNLVPRLFWRCKIWYWGSFFYFKPFFASFVQKINSAFWCYLINFRAVFSQRLEASDFSSLT